MPELVAKEVITLKQIETTLESEGVKEIEVVGDYEELRYEENGLNVTLTPFGGFLEYYNTENWDEEQEELYSWIIENYRPEDYENFD